MAQGRRGSKYVEHKVVTAVESAAARVVVVPASVVDRNSHLGRVAMVQAVGTAVVLVAPEILWVVDVWVVVEPIPILGVVGLAPRTAVGLLGAGLIGVG